MPRVDIQVLRGVAVLLVLFYHAGWSVFSKGYLGVDVFFVISGFLITRIIIRDLGAGVFTFRGFYLRRAYRLLPAAYVVFFCTSMVSVFLLTEVQLTDYLYELLGALSFTGNVVLWQQTGYFGSAAALKPLLHVWSLAIEEQFYLLFPLMLFILRPKFRFLLVIVGMLLSLALCFFLVSHKPSATFYLLPTRAWELLLGACCAFYVVRGGGKEHSWQSLISMVSVVILLVLTTVGLDTVHPRFDALFVCLATGVLILSGPGWLNGGFVPKILGRVGDISYSLYLVHWPLFAFARNITLGEDLGPLVSLSLVVASMGLAGLLYIYVEQPFRHRGSGGGKRRPILIAVVSIVLIIMPLSLAKVVRSDDGKDWSEIRKVNRGFGPECQFEENFTLEKECSSSESPELLVWGDSYAMHIVGGIAASQEFDGVAQATRTLCGPNLYVAHTSAKYPSSWSKSCLEFNASVIAFLKQNNTVKYVVLSSAFSQYFDRLLSKDGERAGSEEIIYESFFSTIVELRELGINVAVVSPPPSSGSNMGLCIEKMYEGIPFRSQVFDTACGFSVLAYKKEQARQISLLSKLEENGVAVIWLEAAVCDGDRCSSVLDGVSIYRDTDHLTEMGSIKVEERLSLAKKIRRLSK
ncbi:MAG: acyltransferase family protein [Pseudomonadales bacterium]